MNRLFYLFFGLFIALLAFVELVNGRLIQNVQQLSEINHFRQSQNDAANIKSSFPKSRHSILDSDGPFCQNLVGYYEGTFTNQQSPSLNYTLQFQVRLNTNQSDQRIHVIFDKWNRSLSQNNQFSFDFAYDGKDIWGDQIAASYWGPFPSKTTDFILTLDHSKHQKWDNSINILYFNVFNNSFQLENSIGQCTSDQLELRNVWNMDSSLVRYCICCGDYAPNNDLLECPINPWANKDPKVPTTKTVTKIAATKILTTEVPTTKIGTTEIPTTKVPTTEVPTTKASSQQCDGKACRGLTTCSSNYNCDCYKTSNNQGFCSVSGACADFRSCDNCPLDFGVCVVESCCGKPVCVPLTYGQECTAPPTQYSLQMAKFFKPKQCKDSLECENGKLCQKHMNGMFCA